MTYEKMTAQELHDLVTRLEAHGFKLPEGLTYRNLPKPHSEHYKPYWAHGGTNYGYPTSFAAAIIEVAARDWWLGKGLLPKEASGADEDIDWRWNIDIERTEATAWRPRFGGKSGPTPLHAIVAAVEAKEEK